MSSLVEHKGTFRVQENIFNIIIGRFGTLVN